MPKPTKYFSLETEEDNGKTVAELNIYGDITSWPWLESDVSAYNLSKQLQELEADEINVRINSFGGEVGEGIAIYNALKRHRAKIKTCVDGFACSIASVIFMAGTVRQMNEASMLMIHNAWCFARGNAKELRKAADDAEKINEMSITAYMSGVNIEEDELRALMDAESYLEPTECLEKGFATEIVNTDSDKPSQSARKQVMMRLLNPYQLDEEEDKPNEAEEEEETTDETSTDDENTTDENETDSGEDQDEAETEETTTEDETETDQDETEEQEDEEDVQQFAFFRAISRL